MFNQNQTITPQQKMINITQKLGVKGIKGMQGTTRLVWDSLLATGETELRFFEGANTRTFPLTNMEKGNKLEVGESLVINFMNFSTFTFLDGVVSGFSSMTDGLADLSPFALAEMEILIANSRVLKPIKLANFLPAFNKSSMNEFSENFYFDSQIVIPPLVEFEVRVRLPEPIVDLNKYWSLTIEGLGAIINTRMPL